MTQATLSAGATAKRYQPKDPAGLSKVVVIVTAVQLAVAAYLIVAEAMHLSVLARFAPGMADSNGAYLPGEQLPSMLVGVGGLLQLLTALTAGFLSLKWVYRVSLNAHALADGLSISPGWNVGWFFVPVADLWLPLKGLREVWAASVDPANWRQAKVAPLLGLWWGVWVAGVIVSIIAFRIQLNAGTVGMATSADLAALISDIVTVPTDLLFILVVRRLSALQTAALASRATAGR